MKIKKSIDREEQRFKKWKDKNGNWKRAGKTINHHILNRCMGGSDDVSNLLKFDEAREKAWHFLWGNKSFEEVAELLLRTVRAKNAQQQRLV